MLLQDVNVGLPLGAGDVEIGPVNLLRLDKEDAISFVRSSVLLRRPTDVAICNAHTLLSAFDDPEYAATLQSMTLFNDGIGTNLASKYLNGFGFPHNLNGTDFIPELLAGIGIPLRIYLLGAQEAQLERARQHIEASYSLHSVVGARNGYFSEDEAEAVCKAISATHADLLLVGMGNPRQEMFIVSNRARLNTTVTFGVGALFDFMSGSVIRAPKMVQALGLEWLFRLLQEPRRLFRRYVIGIPRFLLALRRFKQAKSRA